MCVPALKRASSSETSGRFASDWKNVALSPPFVPGASKQSVPDSEDCTVNVAAMKNFLATLSWCLLALCFEDVAAFTSEKRSELKKKKRLRLALRDSSLMRSVYGQRKLDL